MDKGDDGKHELSRPPADGELDLTEAERTELSRRSMAHRRDPDAAVALDDALESIERSLEY